MPTRILMASSAVFMLALGLVLTFAPQEVLAYAGSVPQPLSTLALQAAGALYLGFAALNWMARASLIGGIYSRPVALGNLFHFLILAIALLKALLSHHTQPVLIVLALLYAVFAFSFWRVVIGSPVKRSAEPAV